MYPWQDIYTWLCEINNQVIKYICGDTYCQSWRVFQLGMLMLFLLSRMHHFQRSFFKVSEKSFALHNFHIDIRHKKFWAKTTRGIIFRNLPKTKIKSSHTFKIILNTRLTDGHVVGDIIWSSIRATKLPVEGRINENHCVGSLWRDGHLILNSKLAIVTIQ